MMKILLFEVVILIATLLYMNSIFAQESLNISKKDSVNITEKEKSRGEYGLLKVEIPILITKPYYIVIDDDYENFKIVSDMFYTKIPVGKRKITVISPEFSDYTFNEIFQNDIVLIHQMRYNKSLFMPQIKNFSKAINDDSFSESSYIWIKTKINTIIKTDHDSQVYVDGRFIDKGIVKIDLSSGQHELMAKHEQVGTTIKRILVNSKKLKIINIYNKPDKFLTSFYAFLPGIAQIYKGDRTKGYSFLGVCSACFLGSLIYQRSFTDNNSKYIYARYQYQRARSNDTALEFGYRADKYLKQAKDDARIRDVLLYSGLSVYLWTVLDAFFDKPKAGYRKNETIKFIPDIGLNNSEDHINLSLNINF